MNKKGELQSGVKIAIVATILIVFTGAIGWYYSRYVAQLRNLNIEYLNEISRHKQLYIEDILDDSMNSLISNAFLYGKSVGSNAADMELLKSLEENSLFDWIRFIDSEGIDYTSTGTKADCSDREYFKDGMRGNTGVMLVKESRVNGHTLIGCYTPIFKNSEIIGVLVGFYDENHIADILKSEIFDEDVEAYMFDADGFVIASSLPNKPADISEIIENAENGELLETLAVEDWYITLLIPQSILDKQTNELKRNTTILVVVMLFVYSITIILVIIDLYSGQRDSKARRREDNYLAEGIAKLTSMTVLIDLSNGTYEYTRGSKPWKNSIASSGAYQEFRRHAQRLLAKASDWDELDSFLNPMHLEGAFVDDNTILRHNFMLNLGDEGVNEYEFSIVCLKRIGDRPSKLLFSRRLV